jgi:hypothetical protein
MSRNRRYTVLLTDEEADLFNAVREPDLPPGTAMRRILMDRIQWLANNGRQQKRPFHTGANTESTVQCDYSDSQ